MMADACYLLIAISASDSLSDTWRSIEVLIVLYCIVLYCIVLYLFGS